ncbi:MAG: gas vesicle protein K [Chloroflexota bacterium]
MRVDIDDDDLRRGLVGLVVALAEIVKETMQLQALRRMEAGSLTEAELERLGQALMDLDEAFDRMKADLGVDDAVRSVRDGLDQAVDDLVNNLLGAESR